MRELAIFSVDDHLIEPPALWTSRLPERYASVAPRVVSWDDGDHWLFEDQDIPTVGISAVMGLSKSEFQHGPFRYSDMLPQAYDSVARLTDMDTDHILASIAFPSFPGFAGRVFTTAKDKELALLCVRAYNDFVFDEWCAGAPGRFVPMVLLPLWDADLCVQEIERTAALGAKAIAFSENPNVLGFPSIHDADGYWDPVFAAAQAADLPLCMHIGSSSQVPRTAPDAPMTVSISILMLNSAMALADWLFSGVFLRFPDLKIVLSEGGIGWIPWSIGRCDQVWETHGLWTKSPLTEPPSEYFRRNCYGCFIDDVFGASVIERIGVDNVMVESDYPHTDMSFPDTAEKVEKALAHLTDDVFRQVVRGNAERVFHFEPSGLGLR